MFDHRPTPQQVVDAANVGIEDAAAHCTVAAAAVVTGAAPQAAGLIATAFDALIAAACFDGRPLSGDRIVLLNDAKVALEQAAGLLDPSDLQVACELAAVSAALAHVRDTVLATLRRR